ncbi:MULTISPECIES: IS4 family transposase [unclassified Thiocapsa]|uniref:IS4 family transposase n=1 Tax=unclassified Thiocapsa TaxID=2641286 RepID=UPI0035AE5255
MQNRELFVKDPLAWQIANEGVSSNNVEDLDTLRYELETFVCQGEYQAGLAKILQGFLDSLDKEQRAAWVSGFFGCGKSHLVKVLRYLWTDFALSDGVTARTLATLPQDIMDLLKELSTRGKQGVGLHSAGGTMKAGVGSVRLRLAGIVLLSVGLPENLSVARLLMDLRDEGTLADIQERIRLAGRDCPEMPCDAVIADAEWQAVYLVTRRQPPPTEPPSLDTMVRMVAGLGGFLNRKGDGFPGPQRIWIGLQRAADFVLALQAQSDASGSYG